MINASLVMKRWLFGAYQLRYWLLVMFWTKFRANWSIFQKTRKNLGKIIKKITFWVTNLKQKLGFLYYKRSFSAGDRKKVYYNRFLYYTNLAIGDLDRVQNIGDSAGTGKNLYYIRFFTIGDFTITDLDCNTNFSLRIVKCWTFTQKPLKDRRDIPIPWFYYHRLNFTA